MLSVLVGCGDNFPNIDFCVDLTRDTGNCTKLLTGEQKDIPKEEWQKFLKKSVKMSFEDAEALVIFAENYCRKKQSNCKAKTKKLIQMFDRKILELKHGSN